MPHAARQDDSEKARIVLGLLESVERDGAQSQRKLAAELGIVYRARFFGHKFELSGVLHDGLLPGETRLTRAA